MLNNPAQHQLDAYNKKDIVSFLEAYSDNVEVYEHPNHLTMSGIKDLKENYSKLFNDFPQMHARLENRIINKNHVIDHEVITGRIENKEIEVIAIYQIDKGKIQKVWFIR